MEARIGLSECVIVAGSSGGLHRIEVLRQRPQVGPGQPRDGEPRRESFERRANHVCLEDLALRGSPYARAPKRCDLDHAQRLEATQGFADRGLAGSELAGDLCLDDPRIGWIVTAQDPFQDAVLDLVRQEAARQGPGDHHVR